MQLIIQIQKNKKDIKKGDYSLERAQESERNPSRKKRVKKLLKKIKKEKGKLTKEWMLTFLELGKELGEDHFNRGNKYDKNVSQ